MVIIPRSNGIRNETECSPPLRLLGTWVWLGLEMNHFETIVHASNQEISLPQDIRVPFNTPRSASCICRYEWLANISGIEQADHGVIAAQSERWQRWVECESSGMCRRRFVDPPADSKQVLDMWVRLYCSYPCFKAHHINVV